MSFINMMIHNFTCQAWALKGGGLVGLTVGGEVGPEGFAVGLWDGARLGFSLKEGEAVGNSVGNCASVTTIRLDHNTAAMPRMKAIECQEGEEGILRRPPMLILIIPLYNLLSFEVGDDNTDTIDLKSVSKVCVRIYINFEFTWKQLNSIVPTSGRVLNCIYEGYALRAFMTLVALATGQFIII